MYETSTDVVKAITNYIVRSIDAVKPLVEMTGGSSGMRTFMKAVNTANSAAYDTTKDWLEQKNAVHQESGDSWRKMAVNNAIKERDCVRDANLFFRCLMVSEPPAGMSKEDFIEKAADEARDCTTQTKLRKYLTRFTKQFGGQWQKFIDEYTNHDEKPFPIKVSMAGSGTSESYDYKSSKVLNEDITSDDMNGDDGRIKTADLEPVDYDKIYNDLLVQLSTAMSESIGPRADWLCFKGIADQMKQLKEAADKEINSKINIVCKTGDQKSLLKYPFKAEGLKGMWARYSNELQSRIDNRINQLMGTQGGSDTGSAQMVEDFLTHTYPQIVAMMVTYRCVFAQIAHEYKNGFVPKLTLEDVHEVLGETAKAYDDDLNVVVDGWENYRD